MKKQLFTLMFGALTLSSTASATPVSYDYLGGTLTTSMSIWTMKVSAFGAAPIAPATLVYDLTGGIGNDFTVAVPRQFTDSLTSWTAVFAGTQGTSPGFDPTLIPGNPAGLELVTATTASGPGGVGTVGNLSDWCTPAVPGTGYQTYFMAVRGACSFTTKIEKAAAIGAGGLIVVNDTPLVGAQGMGLTGPTPDIPTIMLSYERGQQLLGLYDTFFDSYWHSGTSSSGDAPFVQFSATWTPHTVNVPEPGSLALFGIALLCFRRRGINLISSRPPASI